MNGYAGTAAPSAMFVRALYDYAADDRTSLSFRQGDIIQVLNQLESGWWDGMIDGVRGWFPSNYCAIVTDDEDFQSQEEGGEADGEDELREEMEENELDEMGPEPQIRDTAARPNGGGAQAGEHEEAAFWIPQATPDGRLFYFNTLTGVSTMELPLETPTSSTETGPRDRTNIYVPESTRPPPEMLSRGYERDEDDYASASDAEPLSAIENSVGALPFGRGAHATGMQQGSIHRGVPHGDYNHPTYSMLQSTMPLNGTTSTSFATNPIGQQAPAAMAQDYFDDGTAVLLTWDRLVDDMRRSVERFRQAVEDADRASFVKRAEDISDHLRLLLGAGSGTTDNHSGNPSIISTNKALYPHFREMMSRFSKLVLSAHIASEDFPPPDSYAKCLKEAEGVLNGVYNFVEVARQQRGEVIPRLIPGFIPNNFIGGSWRNHGIEQVGGPVNLPFFEQEESEVVAQEPFVILDFGLLERLEELRRMIEQGIKRLDEHLKLQEKLITPYRHQVLGDNVCKAAGRVLDLSRPWMSTVESISLVHLPSDIRTNYLQEMSLHKQLTYDLIMDLIMTCQDACAPLGDEWAAQRGPSLETKFRMISMLCKDLTNCTAEMSKYLKRLSQHMPPPEPGSKDRKVDTGAAYDQRVRNTEQAGANSVVTYSEGNQAKVKKFFGEVPTSMIQQPAQEDVPKYLQLDLEGEVTWEIKNEKPQIKGGTFPALVEQLTRHDRLDSPFNHTFLLTYASFTTGVELFEALVNRWKIQPPYGLTQDDYQKWVEKKQKPIRFRVVNILKTWFDTYWMEGNDEAAKNLMTRVYNFAKEHVATTSTPGAAPLIAAVEQRKKGVEAPKRLVLTLNTTTPQPILPKNLKKIKLLDIDAQELARQMTIIESKLYGKIKTTECLNKTWQRKLGPEEPDPAANIKTLILHSNQLTNWVAGEILRHNEVKRRVLVIKYFVAVAEKCRQLNNFSTLTSIISALGTAPVHRLARTWQQIKGRTMEHVEHMRQLMASSRNFAEYRDTLRAMNPPCIPFLGVFLTDLTFIEDGIPSLIRRTNLINFHKRAKTAEVIRDIQQYQNVPYALQPVPELQEYISNCLRTANDVHEMYDLSLQIEPREREDEKIARLLSESGFL